MNNLDQIKLNFDEESLFLLNLSIAFIMYGVSLGLSSDNFKTVIRSPRAAITGLASQFLLLPVLTFLLVWVLEPHPGLALGMILVAACPGGNISNFFSFVSKGNVALSISLTMLASLLSIIMTPFNIEFWGGFLERKQNLNIDISFLELTQTIVLLIGIPLALGMLTRHYFPRFSEKAQQMIKYFSFLILLTIVGIAFINNYDLFLDYYQYIVLLVLLHNAVALLFGYYFSRFLNNTERDCRTITIETGIQNSGLGLVLIFNFFGGQGSMALITAWWGIWHIISGFIISQYFARKKERTTATV
jgi:bile acid:Na+ symporter, BASS family